MSESLYNREEDRKWRESVDARIVSLTSAQKQSDDDMDEMENRIDTMDNLLEGKPEDKNDTGLKGDIQDLARGLKKLEVIMAPDSLQHGGVIKRLENLEDLAGIKIQTRKERWQFATAVVGVTVTAMAAIITAMLAIEPVRKSVGEYVVSHFLTRSTSTKTRKVSKQTGSKTRRMRVALPAQPSLPAIGTPTEADDEDAAKDDVPEGRRGDGRHY